MANVPTNPEKPSVFQDAWYGEPSQSHALGAAQILETLNLDESTLVAANHIARIHGKEALVKLIGDEATKLFIGLPRFTTGASQISPRR